MNHAMSYLTVRRLKRAIITTFVCVVILLMWRWTSWRPSATSAVGCKSKLAQVGIQLYIQYATYQSNPL